MRIARALLAMMAYHVLWPGLLVNVIHRLRGVKIQDLRTTVIAYHVLIDPIYPELVEIGAGAWITQQCVLLAHFRPTPAQAQLIGGDRVRSVKIGKGAYLGVGSIILPGVTVGDCAVVGAGSVVTKDVPAYSVAAGNPARVLKTVKEIAPARQVKD